MVLVFFEDFFAFKTEGNLFVNQNLGPFQWKEYGKSLWKQSTQNHTKMIHNRKIKWFIVNEDRL